MLVAVLIVAVIADANMREYVSTPYNYWIVPLFKMTHGCLGGGLVR